MHIRVDEISRRLSDRAESVCQLLLNGGKRVRNEWLAGDISGVGGESLKVTLTGEHAGHWRDWSAGDELKGDLLDLWRFSRNLSRAEVIREAKSFLGIVDPIDHGHGKSWATPQNNGCRPLDPNGPAIHYLHVDRKLDHPKCPALRGRDPHTRPPLEVSGGVEITPQIGLHAGSR